MSRRIKITMPTGEAFPQECSICQMCGHNAKTHARFMELFPEIKVCHCKSWIRNQVQHICVWCNPPNLERFRKKVERLQSTKKDSSSPRLQAARPTRVQ